MFNEHEEILTVEELMDILYIGKNTAYQLLNSKQVAGFKIGRVWKIPRQAVTQYIIKQSRSQ